MRTRSIPANWKPAAALTVMALAAAVACSSGPAVEKTGDAAAAPAADRIWSGGPILTMNDAAMKAEAVAEKGGRIIAVGAAADVMRHKGPQTRMIDLAGRAMLPGFVDAHGHVMGGGIQALSANLLAPPDGNVKDIASMLETLRTWMAANDAAVKKVNLILGFGYDNSTLAEHRHPTRDELDRISKDTPVLLVHQSGHLSAVNSKALEVLGITAATRSARRRHPPAEGEHRTPTASWRKRRTTRR